MSSQRNSLQELIRRALTAQVELGYGELVIGSGRSTNAYEVASELSDETHVVSVSEAVQSQANVLPIQGMMSLSDSDSFLTLEDHCKAICDCRLCPLGETRNKFVYGIGNPHADIMFVGEAPGADEDRLGEPFVGRAGKLLDQILKAMKLSRNEVYISNILKCRPPGNRDPQPEEMAKCFGYLREQIRLIQPKIICALGRIAAQAMLNTTTPLGKLRNTWHSFEGVPMIATYHPAALLRFVQYKKDTWADMQMLMARYKEMS